MSDSSKNLSLKVNSVILRSSVKASSYSKGNSIRFSYLFTRVVTSQPIGRLQTRHVSLWRVRLEIQKGEQERERRMERNGIGLWWEGNKTRLVKVKFRKIGGATIKTWFYLNEEKNCDEEMCLSGKRNNNLRGSFLQEKKQRCFFMNVFLCFWRDSPPVGHGLLIHEVPISHNDAPQSVGLLWTSDQTVAETSTWPHTTLTTDRHPCLRRYSNPQCQQASGRRPTP